MSEPAGQTARRVALEVLNRCDRRRGDSRQVLHEHIETIQATGVKAAATDMVYGVLRNRALLDKLISRCSGLPGGRIRMNLRNILRIGMYELVYSPATPEHAAVNEAVNLAHAAGGRKGAGFVNAVLRNAARMISRRSAPLRDAAARRCIPYDVVTGCEFGEDILPDPMSDTAAYLAEAYSLPQWLVEDWLQHHGAEAARRICAASNRRPGIYVQPNTLRTTAEELFNIFSAAGVACDIVAGGTMLKLRAHTAIESLPGYGEGLFIVQDPTAAGVVKMLAAAPGQTVLDLCAAPGGKTVGLAQLMQDRGRIVATDIDAERLGMVAENCRRLGITIVECAAQDRLAEAVASSAHWDAVLVDVPCSNTGVLARRPEVRLRLTPGAIQSLAGVQLRLLEQAAAIVSPGGRICYSTCSIQTSENIEVVETFLRRHPAFHPERQELTLPFVAEDLSFDFDGGFVAVLLRQR
ncbi:MAG TPA: 16S rRNA (cytosine(967)-C(5))-methyltransferase RsmB [Anaerohalosphaeraceae bacterium]|jgi:16S rRNA (cytosine967-C5)-methyltransferase|nr:16S rRNA (cytosine(967)-C(5))-methyltransferase RsmB [Anaerohalosphaeraceae bacterium]HRT50292.1 16S rRNA (cytosine(967)-C(5))-methyltransferase RsmB [Anaerohalosphaeraceae bacterium]HRT86188.1 16S rRNA (cytosine(967)-C(5))-methyltransferase RsmB [Anaerohalosphaeraceae bacterium]